MSTKQTAVDWLIEELGEYFPHEIGGIHLMVKQAKSMEKEQMIEFSNKVLYNAECSFTGRAYLEKDINEFYKETYEK